MNQLFNIQSDELSKFELRPTGLYRFCCVYRTTYKSHAMYTKYSIRNAYSQSTPLNYVKGKKGEGRGTGEGGAEKRV